MKSYEFDGGQYLLVLERGEDVLRSIVAFAREKGLEGASLQGIGAVDVAHLGQYDYEVKDYRVLEFRGALEVVSLIGNIAMREGAPFAHVHMTVTNPEGRCIAG